MKNSDFRQARKSSKPHRIASGCVSNHSARAAMAGSSPAVFHHPASSPQRRISRWCPRHNGTANSSLTWRPSAQVMGIHGLPAANQAGLIGNRLDVRSRTRRSSGRASRLLSNTSECGRLSGSPEYGPRGNSSVGVCCTAPQSGRSGICVLRTS